MCHSSGIETMVILIFICKITIQKVLERLQIYMSWITYLYIFSISNSFISLFIHFIDTINFI